MGILMKSANIYTETSKIISAASAAVLLFAIAYTGSANAYTMSTAPADLTQTELWTNYNNRSNSAGDVAAHDGYAGTTHDTAEWNQLGRSNTADDGVLWSVNGGAWGTDEIIATGQFTIQFQISLWSAGYGNHDYDQVKAWVDWNNDDYFLNDNLTVPSDASYQAGETILAGKYDKDASQIASEIGKDDRWRIWRNENYDTMTTFVTGPFTVTEDMLDSLTLGDFEGYWLRARSQCDHVGYNSMNPYSNLWQGEAEDYFIKITDGREVPEPATMVLFGTGMMGLAAWRRRSKK